MFTYLDTDEITIKVALSPEGLWFFHCDVKEWSKSFYKAYIQVMLDMKDYFNDMGVPTVYAHIDNNKLERFAKMFGWEYVVDVDKYKIYKMGEY